MKDALHRAFALMVGDNETYTKVIEKKDSEHEFDYNLVLGKDFVTKIWILIDLIPFPSKKRDEYAIYFWRKGKEKSVPVDFIKQIESDDRDDSIFPDIQIMFDERGFVIGGMCTDEIIFTVDENHPDAWIEKQIVRFREKYLVATANLEVV